MIALQGKRILVTGGSGFIGLHLLQRLMVEDAQVFCLALPGETSTRSRLAPCTVLEADIRDRSAVFRVFDSTQPEVVFHLAAVGVTQHDIEPEVALEVNVGGTLNVLEACRHIRVSRLVHVGTSYEYCDPATAYIASKFAAWAFVRGYARDERLPVVCLRLFNAYGPAQPAKALVAAAILAALKDQDLEMTPGEQQRDFIHTKDLADGIVRAAVQPGIDGMTLDLGTGCGVEVAHLVRLAYTMVGGKGSPQVGALPYRNWEVMRLVADADRTERLMDWRYRVGLDEGLAETIEWYRNQILDGDPVG